MTDRVLKAQPSWNVLKVNGVEGCRTLDETWPCQGNFISHHCDVKSRAFTFQARHALEDGIVLRDTVLGKGL
jgi:hypothetical protein